ncbi:ABC transporter ATP-binding protein [Paucibacter sp. B2R-40]|uniref:ABC transporter ATP-binding protein n=1 Tax=Paucibacter sp. B2R-40 TaxID=2893554 RepID=UPI0021E45A86|nr:ABC transporter ATP-binding protein [Paucibacter sp. B2R-40]MCV2352573.1 ABC transporter ATP-binding protein [Paucibacter sp. B2R-40]
MLQASLHQAGAIPLDLNLHCANGELLALVGPSGSGKTSVLRALAGLLPVNSGRISLGEQLWFDSERGIDVPAERRGVGMVFQHYALFPHLSALDNVSLAIPGGSGAGARKERREHALQLLADMQLDGLAERRPEQLSGGQRQRVALARALARKPQLLLLDEAFSAVDQPTRYALWEELVKLRERLTLPIIMVTHDLREARLLADRLCILEAGTALQDGPPEQVLARPRNARVAALVGLRDIHSGLFRKQSSGGAVLKWGEGKSDGEGVPQLQIIDKGRIEDGTPVRWVISGEFIQCHTAAPATPVVNLVAAELIELRSLGETSTLKLAVQGSAKAHVHLDIGTRQLRQSGWRVGQVLLLELDPAGIHVMPVRS